MTKKILLTGSSGFVGQHLKLALTKAGYKVYGEEFDLRKIEQVKKIANLETWDVVIHLAGLSSNAQVITDQVNAFDINVRGTFLLAQEILKKSKQAHFIFPSTGYVYKSNLSENYFSEDSELLPANAYSETKLYAEILLKSLAITKGLRVSTLRLFNHTHNSQTSDFLLSYVYSEFLKAGTSEIELPIGNVEVSRDFGCIQDLILAFLAVIKLDSYDSNYEVYNVSSGSAFKLSDLISELAKQMNVKFSFKIDPNRLRANDPQYLSGNSEKLQNKTGWHPRVNSPESLIKFFLKEI